MANWASAGEMLDAQKSLKGAISYFDLNRMVADYKPIETYLKKMPFDNTKNYNSDPRICQ